MSLQPECLDQQHISNKKSRWRKEKGHSPSIFIAKTFEILQNQLYCDVVNWNEDGTNFMIYDVERFQKEVLPIYFRHSNFSSFVRQLNMYDFHKIRNELNKSIFQHKCFRKNSKHLLKNIKRKGCSSKRNHEQADDKTYSDSESLVENEEDIESKENNLRNTVNSIEKISQSHVSSLHVISLQEIENVQKLEAIEQFLNSLPDILSSEQEVKLAIKKLRNDYEFAGLTSKDIRNVIKKIRRQKFRKNEDDLEELSIEEEIMVHNVEEQSPINLSLAILTSNNFIPAKSASYISSLILCDSLLYHK